MSSSLELHDSGSPLVRLCGVSKSFGGTKALSDVDLDIELGQVHAIAGENGAGKSTLIKIVMGVLQPDVGWLEVAGRRLEFSSPTVARSEGFAAVYQEPLIYPHLSVLDNIFVSRPIRGRLGAMDRRAMRRAAIEVFQELQVDEEVLDQKMGELRLGYQQLVLIAQALIDEARLVVFDEPTSILSATETDHLFSVIRKLRDAGKAIVYISHRFEELEEIADRITVLTDGRAVGEQVQRPFDIDAVISLMTGTASRSFGEHQPRIGLKRGAPVLEVKKLTRLPHYRDVSWTAYRGEVLGFYGQVGAGRSEMAQGIFGSLPPSSGIVSIEGRVLRAKSPREAIRAGVGYLPEDRKSQGIFSFQSVADNMVSVVVRRLCSSVLGYVYRSKVAETVDQFREVLQIKMPGMSVPITSLSGGGQQKVVLGRWMAERLKLIILDEPTRGIDVMTKAQFYKTIRELADANMAVVVISSDLPEVLAVSDRVGVMRLGRLVGIFQNDGSLSPEEVLRRAVGGATEEDASEGRSSHELLEEVRVKKGGNVAGTAEVLGK